MKHDLIGLSGSGKSEVAAILEIEGYTRQRFAGALKAMMSALIEYTWHQDAEYAHRCVDGDLKEDPSPALCGLTPRHAMQMLGTEWGRAHMGVDFWAEVSRPKIEYLLQYGPVVIDDVRFANEVDLIREMGGTVLRIDRPGLTPGDHVSEQFDFAPDGVISNFGTLADLQEGVSYMILDAHASNLPAPDVNAA